MKVTMRSITYRKITLIQHMRMSIATYPWNWQQLLHLQALARQLPRSQASYCMIQPTASITLAVGSINVACAYQGRGWQVQVLIRKSSLYRKNPVSGVGICPGASKSRDFDTETAFSLQPSSQLQLQLQTPNSVRKLSGSCQN